jgi:hypothetical protein
VRVEQESSKEAGGIADVDDGGNVDSGGGGVNDENKLTALGDGSEGGDVSLAQNNESHVHIPMVSNQDEETEVLTLTLKNPPSPHHHHPDKELDMPSPKSPAGGKEGLSSHVISFDDFEEEDRDCFIPGRIASNKWIDFSKGRPPDLGYSSCV